MKVDITSNQRCFCVSSCGWNYSTTAFGNKLKLELMDRKIYNEESESGYKGAEYD